MLHSLQSVLPLPDIAFWLVALGISLYFLLKSSDIFCNNAETIGTSLGLSQFVIGMTILAMGTSLPELVSSVAAVLKGNSEIVAGNVVGSNIANLLLILGLAALLEGHMRIKKRISVVDLPFMLGATFLLAFVLWSGSVVRIEALILIAGIAIYLHYVVINPPEFDDEYEEDHEAGAKKQKQIWAWVFLGLSSFGLFLGAKGTVDSVVEIARAFNLGTEIIAASVVAIGTSLPEVGVTIAAARKGRSEMAVGNVLGSNIFNALAVTGIAALTGTLIVPANIVEFAVPVMLASTLLVYFTIMQQELTRWEGSLFFLIYIYFVLELIDII